jgi:tRNA 2-selenouridine synthase
MRLGSPIRIEASMNDRVQLWREDYRHFEEDPQAMLEQLKHLRQFVGGEEFTVWQELADRHAMPELFERLMKNHYDPSYRRSILRHYPKIDNSHMMELHDLSPAGLKWSAENLLKTFER